MTLADMTTLTSVDGLISAAHLDSYVASLLKIIGADLVLSGDNAVVIALAARSLPAQQRMWGVILGGAAAVILRIALTLILGTLLDVPLLSLLGGLGLLWIAIKLMISHNINTDIGAGQTLWDAVRIIIAADVIMSVDNILAIAGAAKGDWSLIITGLALSIPLIVGGSTLVMRLMDAFPQIVWAGGALLGWIAGELIAHETFVSGWLTAKAMAVNVGMGSVETACGVAGALFVVVVAWFINGRTKPLQL